MLLALLPHESFKFELGLDDAVVVAAIVDKICWSKFSWSCPIIDALKLAFNEEGERGGETSGVSFWEELADFVWLLERFLPFDVLFILFFKK